MVDNVTGLGLDQAQIADAINRQKIGSQRQRNEMMRLGTSDPTAFALQNKTQLDQAKQPSEFWGAGRKEASNQNVAQDSWGLIDVAAPKLGGVRNYYGDTDWTTPEGLKSLYDKTGYSAYKQTPQQKPIPDLWSNINPNNFRGANYTRAVEDAKKFASYGFVPGQTPKGWSYTPGAVGVAKGAYRGPDAGFWNRGDQLLGYRQGYGYSTTTDTTDTKWIDPESAAIMGTVIGGIILPGLGGAIAGGASGGLGATATELAIDAGALGGANTGALGAASLGAPGLLGSGGIFGTGMDIGNIYANQLAENVVKNVASGGDVKKATLGSLFGMASGGIGNQLSSAVSPQLGSTIGKMMGGAASGGLNSLYSSNSPLSGSLYGAMSGGLHGFLNSTASGTNRFDREMDLRNRNIANTTTGIAKLFANRNNNGTRTTKSG